MVLLVYCISGRHRCVHDLLMRLTMYHRFIEILVRFPATLLRAHTPVKFHSVTCVLDRLSLI